MQRNEVVGSTARVRVAAVRVGKGVVAAAAAAADDGGERSVVAHGMIGGLRDEAPSLSVARHCDLVGSPRGAVDVLEWSVVEQRTVPVVQKTVAIRRAVASSRTLLGWAAPDGIGEQKPDVQGPVQSRIAAVPLAHRQSVDERLGRVEDRRLVGRSPHFDSDRVHELVAVGCVAGS